MLDDNPLAGRLLDELREAVARLMAADPQGTLSAASGNERCYVRACVMPAIPGAGECAAHRLEREQGKFFESQQPSLAVLLANKYACLPILDDEFFATIRLRSRDRRRLALEYTCKLEAE